MTRGRGAAMDDSFRLQRFVEAQAGVHEIALGELRGGRKRSHWMWFVFPQVAGLGQSPTAREYAIGSLREARAYLEHPVLGARLRECAQVLLDVDDAAGDAESIFGGLDAMKLRSSMTLFDRAAPGEVFAAVLERYFGGRRDERTLELLS